MFKKINKLTDLKTVELTLTKKGANNKFFALTKGRVIMEPEVLLALVNTPAEDEEEFIKTMKSFDLSDEESNAAIVQYRLQKGMKDLVSDDVMSTLSKSAGYKREEQNQKFKQNNKKTVEKNIDFSKLDENSKKLFETMVKSNENMQTVIKSLTNKISDLENQSLEKHFVSKAAKEYSHLPMAGKDLGLLLKSAHDMNPDFAKGFESLLGKMDEMVSKSSMLTIAGAVSRTKQGGAVNKLETMASSIVNKSTEGGHRINKHAAIDAILNSEDGDSIYKEYLNENPKQKGDFDY